MDRIYIPPDILYPAGSLVKYPVPARISRFFPILSGYLLSCPSYLNFIKYFLQDVRQRKSKKHLPSLQERAYLKSFEKVHHPVAYDTKTLSPAVMSANRKNSSGKNNNCLSSREGKTCHTSIENEMCPPDKKSSHGSSESTTPTSPCPPPPYFQRENSCTAMQNKKCLISPEDNNYLPNLTSSNDPLTQNSKDCLPSLAGKGCPPPLEPTIISNFTYQKTRFTISNAVIKFNHQDFILDFNIEGFYSFNFNPDFSLRWYFIIVTRM